MIKARIVRDKDGFIQEFTIEGHAGQGKHGSDIVCAAVSAVAYTTVGSLEELAGIKGYVEQDGYMRCQIPQDITGDAKSTAAIILDSMAIGLKQIEYSYGKYVKVLDEEV